MNILIKFALRLVIFTFISMMVLAACYPNNAASNPTLPPTALVQTAMVPSATNPIPTITMTPTREAIPSLTTTSTNIPPTQTPIIPYASDYNSLLPGQYIVYSPGNGLVSYGVLSLDGKFQSKLVKGVDTALGAFTRDGKRLAFSDPEHEDFVIYDLVENTVIKILGARYCYCLDWSPDELQIVTACAGQLETILLKNGNVTLLASGLGLYQGDGENPHWSPDGRWIAFIYWGDGPSDPENGIYVMSVDCLKEPAACVEKTMGPFLGPAMNFDNGSGMTWSPDSQHLAVLNPREDTIQVIDIQDGSVRTIVGHNAMGDLSGIAWSPDGNWIAFGVSAVDGQLFFGVYLISPQGGEPPLLGQGIGDVIDWITVPWPYAPGDLYTITDDGVNLNLRSGPSLDADILRKLQPGDKIIIVEGPVNADGYTWWEMKTEDGLEGWAVDIPEWYAPEKH